MGLFYLAATRKDGNSSVEAAAWCVVETKGAGWVRGRLREW